MKTKRFYKVLLVSLVVLLLMTSLVVYAGNGRNTPSTQIILHVKGAFSVEALIEDDGEPMGNFGGQDSPDGWFTLKRYGNVWKLPDDKMNHLFLLKAFMVDGVRYNVPDDLRKVGQEGHDGEGSNNYWLDLPEPTKPPIPE